jgi:sterol desaturase/sphingolipid hydroxylase (fatty acid hydroxylase superfamily)
MTTLVHGRPLKLKRILAWALVLLFLLSVALSFENFTLKLQSLVSGFSIHWTTTVQASLTALGVLIFEVIFVGYKNSSLHELLQFKNHSSRLDLYFFLFLIFNGTWLLDSTLFVLFHFVGDQLALALQTQALASPTAFPVINWIFFFYVREFFDYWVHRFQHSWKPFWQMHKVHHSADSFTVLTLFRIHSGDLVIEKFFKIVPLSLMGVPFEQTLSYIVIDQVFHFLQHSRLDHYWGFVGRWILMPPMAHRIHHSLHERHHHKNYGSLTPLFDHLFGTWCGEKVSLKELGVKDVGQENFWQMLYRPFLNFLKEFKLILKGP